MCGRFAINDEVNEQITAWVESGRPADAWRPSDWLLPEQLEARYSVAPGMLVPVLENTEARAVWAQWGFRPVWAKPDSPTPINARLETVASKGYFKQAFAGHRGLVPMCGYFEWQATPTGKQPFYIHGDGPLFAAAIMSGIGDERNIAIITNPGVDAAGEIHDRMPVLLDGDIASAWISRDKFSRPDVAAQIEMGMKAASTQIAAGLSAHPVSRVLNNVRTLDAHDPHLLDPVDLSTPDSE